jgi:hypothetical protein
MNLVFVLSCVVALSVILLALKYLPTGFWGSGE